MSDGTYQLKEGKGSIWSNKKEDEKHDYYGSFCSPRDIKAGEVIKFQGYKNESQGGTKYIGLQILDKREPDL